MATNECTKTYYFLKRITPNEDQKYNIIPLKSSNVLVGRAQECSFPIADVTISRRHALFKRTGDSWTITNLSINGVLLDGKELPLEQERPLPLASTVQLCVQPQKFVFKFGCKVIGARRRESGALDSNNSTNSCASSTSTLTPASTSLLNEYRNLQEQLHSNHDKYSRLLKEKQQLAESSLQQQKELEKKYDEERAELQRQVSDEQKKRELRESEEALAQQQQEQVQELQKRLKFERQELDQMMEQERELKQQLQQEQEAVKLQLKAEKKALESRLEREREQMKEQVDERVQEVEQQMQLRLKQVEEHLQQEKQNASLLSHELEQKALSAERVTALEQEKANLQQQLEAAHAEGHQVNELQQRVQQMEQERTSLQEQMEMMEFAVTAEAKKAVVDTVEEVVDSELQCPICNELFIQAILLNCSHTFCQYCINCWKKTKRDCPSCRAPLRTETRNLAIDSFIDKILLTLSQDTRNNRQQMVKEREEEIKAAEAKQRADVLAREEARNNRGRGRWGNRRGARNRGRAASRGSHGRGGGSVNTGNQQLREPSGNERGGGALAAQAPPPNVFNVAPPITLSSDSDSDARSRSYNSDSSSVEGDDDVYFGGYGRCFNCGRRGHWANGCPEI